MSTAVAALPDREGQDDGGDGPRDGEDDDGERNPTETIVMMPKIAVPFCENVIAWNTYDVHASSERPDATCAHRAAVAGRSCLPRNRRYVSA
jgi:hypothetical protein